MLSMALVPDSFPDAKLWDLLTALGARWFTYDTNHPSFETAKNDLASLATQL